MATCAVSGTLMDPSETAISGATVRFTIQTPNFNGSTINFFAPKEITTTTASNGTWTLNISQGMSGVISFDYPPNSTDSTRRINYSVVIPAASTASFESIATEL